VRDAIAATFPDIFHDFNTRLAAPEGFHRPVAARRRVWETGNGKANFLGYGSLIANLDAPEAGADVLRLMTLRSDDQFNTTIYSMDDRFRAVKGTRQVLFINPADMQRLGLAEGETVALQTVFNDAHTRRVAGLRVTPYAIPPGCVGGYYPECNPLLPLSHHAEESKVPAAKSIPVRIIRNFESTQAAPVRA
jgi:anaerobic selenocysteine-containing dehydrogenase